MPKLGRINFERLYDIPVRVLPADILDQPSLPEADAPRQLVRIAAQALGVATEPDLRDYLRLPRAASKARVAELVETRTTDQSVASRGVLTPGRPRQSPRVTRAHPRR